ncbi:cyclodeaminase/cyclohydrolase family protein, partial [bacterium]|nr:cyclodeaminase/cyclohydrolase family protein [bacterium]
MKFDYMRQPLKKYFERISSKTPVPGGGSVSACIGALSSSLLNMVLNYTIGKEKYAEYEEEFKKIKKRNDEILNEFTEFIE